MVIDSLFLNFRMVGLTFCSFSFISDPSCQVLYELRLSIAITLQGICYKFFFVPTSRPFFLRSSALFSISIFVFPIFTFLFFLLPFLMFVFACFFILFLFSFFPFFILLLLLVLLLLVLFLQFESQAKRTTHI